MAEVVELAQQSSSSKDISRGSLEERILASRKKLKEMYDDKGIVLGSEEANGEAPARERPLMGVPVQEGTIPTHPKHPSGTSEKGRAEAAGIGGWLGGSGHEGVTSKTLPTTVNAWSDKAAKQTREELALVMSGKAPGAGAAADQSTKGGLSFDASDLYAPLTKEKSSVTSQPVAKDAPEGQLFAAIATANASQGVTGSTGFPILLCIIVCVVASPDYGS